MPRAQMQIVSGDAVMHAETLDLRDNHEYLEALSRLQGECLEGESVRTVGSDSPLAVRTPGGLL